MRYFLGIFSIIAIGSLIVTPVTLFNEGRSDSISGAFLHVWSDWKNWLVVFTVATAGAATLTLVVKMFEMLGRK